MFAQTAWTLVRSSLALRMAHLRRAVPWSLLAASVRRVEQVLIAATAALFRLSAGPDAAAPAGVSTAPPALLEQITLPVRHGGFGLHTTSSVEADAALLSGAAKAQHAMAGAAASSRPFDGNSRPALQAAFDRVWGDIGDAGSPAKWGDASRPLPPEFVAGRLAGVQGEVSRAVQDRDGAALLARCDVTTPAGKLAAARLRSCSSGAGSAWLSASRACMHTKLSDVEFVSGGHHRLGLGPRSDVQLPACPCNGVAPTDERNAPPAADAADPTAPDHCMSCKTAAGERTLRHTFTASAWRQSISAAGLSTSMEPSYRRLAQNAAAAAAAGSRRGDIFTILPDGSITVLDAVVTHPCGRSCVGPASKHDGHAAAKAAKQKEDSFASAMGDGAGYTFVPLAMESFGRLGTAATQFLNRLGGIAAQEGRVTKAAFVRAAHRRISCAIVRGNARVYSSVAVRLVRASGHGFLRGSDVMVAENVD